MTNLVAKMFTGAVLGASASGACSMWRGDDLRNVTANAGLGAISGGGGGAALHVAQEYFGDGVAATVKAACIGGVTTGLIAFGGSHVLAQPAVRNALKLDSSVPDPRAGERQPLRAA